MKRIQLFALAAALMMAAACNNDISDVGGDISPTEPTSEQMPEVTFTPEEMGYLTELANGTPKISVDSAAKVALQVMGNRLSKSTLSVTAFGTPKAGSLSKSFFDSDIDTTLYVFNAPGGNGFAVISADARIPQQVLAYSEDGNLELDSDNPAFAVFLDCATNYAASCIAKAQEQRDSIENSILVKLGIKTEDTISTSLSKKEVLYRGLLTNMCSANIYYNNTAEIKPLIKTNWHQKKPYNDKCDHPKDCVDGYPAGCDAIATSQLIAFWRYPNVIGGVKYDWTLINNDSKIDDPKYKTQVASLVAYVGSGIDTQYACGVSSSNLRNDINFLHKLHYSVSNLIGFDYDKIVKSLENGCPVLMRGIQRDASCGHAWLVDGYVRQVVTKTTELTYVVVERDDNGVVSSHYEKEKGGYSSTTNKFLHINWGWGEGSNGYYSQGVFHVGVRRLQDATGKYDLKAPEYNADNDYTEGFSMSVNIHK